jgi:hypothetical protein
MEERKKIFKIKFIVFIFRSAHEEREFISWSDRDVNIEWWFSGCGAIRRSNVRCALISISSISIRNDHKLSVQISLSLEILFIKNVNFFHARKNFISSSCLVCACCPYHVLIISYGCWLYEYICGYLGFQHQTCGWGERNNKREFNDI